MSRSKDRGWKANHRGCSGCPRCDWYPKDLQDSGKRTLRVINDEVEEDIQIRNESDGTCDQQPH